jgi:hypothetical protein
MLADMDLCQLVISLETQVIEENVYPQIKLKEVAFTMNNKPGSFSVTLANDAPLFKKGKVEDSLKEWMQNNLKSREKHFHEELQRSLIEIMESFAFKKEIQVSEKISGLLGKTAAHSSLSEVMKL